MDLANAARASHAASIQSRQRPSTVKKNVPITTTTSSLTTSLPTPTTLSFSSGLPPTSSTCVQHYAVRVWKYPILNAGEITAFENILNFPLPEMIFGNNRIEIANPEKSFHIHFNPLDALKCVDHSDQFKVSYSNDWINDKLKSNVNNTIPMNIHNPFNWTYSTNYNGTLSATSPKWQTDTDNTHLIPLDKLSQSNKILFFTDLPLFEDELADNGISSLNVKIRVMQNCLLLLQRLFIRLDDVFLKIIDTRLFIDFTENIVINEQKTMYDDYAKILAKATSSSTNDPKKLLRDINWCCANLNLVETKRLYTHL